jgi:hypothetical protein
MDADADAPAPKRMVWERIVMPARVDGVSVVPHTTDLAREGLAVRVSALRQADVEWLGENLAPCFVAATASHPDWWIEVAVTPRRHELLVRRLTDGGGGPSAGFQIDGDPGAIVGLASDPGTFHDSELDVFYSADVERRRIEVIAAAPRDATRIALLRVVREIATDHLVDRGWIPFHASAYSDAGRGVLVVGPKRAGKTSLLMHALASPSSRPISNDRAIVGLSADGTLRLEGLPTVVRIRSGTAELLGLGGVSAAGHWRARQTLAEAERSRSTGTPTAASLPLSLSPRQFHHLLDRAPVADASLHQILFPRVDPGHVGMTALPLLPQEAAERLQVNRLPSGTSPLLHRNGGPARTDGADAAIKRLVAACPAWECILGRGAFDEPYLAGSIVRRFTSG